MVTGDLFSLQYPWNSYSSTLFDGYSVYYKLLDDELKALSFSRYEKSLLGTCKSTTWIRYLLASFYLHNIDISLWPCLSRDGTMLSHWFTTHKTHIFIINFISDHVCMHIYKASDVVIVFFSFCRSSLIYFLAVWHDDFVATYWTILIHHLSAVGNLGRTIWETFLCTITV